MTHPNKVKGDNYERAVRDFLKANGHPYAERCFGAGRRDDQGDILGLPGIVCQVKNCAKLDLSGWLDQAEAQRVTARAQIAVVVAKRRGKPVDKSYVVMDLETFARLVD